MLFRSGSAAAVLAGLRADGTINAGTGVLRPEKSTNWGIGAEFAPTNFLKGLDIQATWYKIKITDVLQAVGNPSSDTFNNPLTSYAYLTPSDFAGVAGNANCSTSNQAPTTCAAFEAAALALLSNPRSAVNPAFSTLAYWINDSGTFNKGWLSVEGIDWNVSYDWDMGDIGAFNVGAVGTYYLHQLQQNAPGAPVTDVLYNTTINVGTLTMTGVESLPRFKYRARMGWANGPWNFTTFMNYESHFFHTQTLPPNVNNQCIAAGSPVPGSGTTSLNSSSTTVGVAGTYPCAITGYTNLEPSFYTFDVSLGYDTGDDPANDYLKHINVQLVVQNIFSRRSPFAYRVSSGGGNPTAYDILKNDMGRTISISVTKTW